MLRVPIGPIGSTGSQHTREESPGSGELCTNRTGASQAEQGLTLDSSKGRQVLCCQQRGRQLSDESLQQPRHIVLVNLIPAEQAAVEVPFQLLFQALRKRWNLSHALISKCKRNFIAEHREGNASSQKSAETLSTHSWISQQWRFLVAMGTGQDNSSYLNTCFSKCSLITSDTFKLLRNSYLDSGLGPRNSQDALCFKSSLLQAGQQLSKGETESS